MSTKVSTTQAGRTPRRTTRRATATPVRDVSPPAHNTRAGSTALTDTPVTRRSTRGASKRPHQQSGTVNNEALPEIQTRQSYAYGSSKTPLLPEQLHARDPLTMKQVANQMDTAMSEEDIEDEDEVEEEIEDGRQQSQQQVQNIQTTRRTSRQPSSPVSVTTDMQKKHRTAAWATSLDTGQLEDIPEEQQQGQLDTPETKRTDPSSFPSGVFDHSYQYERGLRPPRKPPKPKTSSVGAKIGAVFDRFLFNLDQLRQTLINYLHALSQWFVQTFRSFSTFVARLPGTQILTALIKVLAFVAFLGLLNYTICFGYTRYVCNPESESRLSQTLVSWCGACQVATNDTGSLLGSEADIRKLTLALNRINSQIQNVESRLNTRLDDQFANINTDINYLRQEQSNIIQQIDELSSQPNIQPDTPNMPFPQIPKMNYFCPANGAVISPHLTSPTRRVPMNLALRFMARLLRMKYHGPGPLVALESWSDIGDCWCAAATLPSQDSIRLGVGIVEYIFPTELVIEHPSRETILTPETAPKHLELWANFNHVEQDKWNELGLDTMTNQSPGRGNPFGKKFALIASIEYELGTHGHQSQSFTLDVNQYGDLRYSAKEYAIRVTSTHGSDYGCLYRVRLHGEPVEKRENFSDGGMGDQTTGG